MEGNLQNSIKNTFQSLRIETLWVREFIAEVLGTMILVLIGDATVAQVILSDKLGTPLGSFFTINWGYGMAVAMGVFISGGVSGAHLNPSVSVALATVGKFPWAKVSYYILAQYIGAFLGAAIVYVLYYDALQLVGITMSDTAGVFSTYPSTHISLVGKVVDQILGTAMLLLLVSAITDERNMKVPVYMLPFFLGIAVFNIGTGFGLNCGYAINPARDLGPRLFTAIAGWGSGPFTSGDYYFWIPIVACHIGAILGVLIYQLAIESHWPLSQSIVK